MPFRTLLHYPAVRLVLETAGAALVLTIGVEMIAHANGSTWAPLIGGPAITLAGAHLIILARAWHDHLGRAAKARKNPADGTAGPQPAEARSGTGQ
ncbi:hypothetical protein LVY72_19845 [Arthrobacter sp. I2-34]|uniref:Uncharacterized protein n=1 Tax=Arthrobacter hankyongi TaxID=2904801 RepID=A0ABS9LBT4_9MICC|nr:hypothetical protein [Arthrobacter hankyongi]MCG2624144.1 hypothetical protein [Arthrobacter hankyongi]